jgi:hypothetical protein
LRVVDYSTKDEIHSHLLGLQPRYFRLQLSGHEKELSTSDAHHQVNPIGIGVASMIAGSLIGAGIVLSFGQRHVEPDLAEELQGSLGVESRTSQPFVPFQGVGNRMGEEIAVSDVGLSVAAERVPRTEPAVASSSATQEEARLKAEQESRSKAKAKQKAEEEAKLKEQRHVPALSTAQGSEGSSERGRDQARSKASQEQD